MHHPVIIQSQSRHAFEISAAFNPSLTACDTRPVAGSLITRALGIMTRPASTGERKNARRAALASCRLCAAEVAEVVVVVVVEDAADEVVVVVVVAGVVLVPLGADSTSASSAVVALHSPL